MPQLPGHKYLMTFRAVEILLHQYSYEIHKSNLIKIYRVLIDLIWDLYS